MTFWPSMVISFAVSLATVSMIDQAYTGVSQWMRRLKCNS